MLIKFLLVYFISLPAWSYRLTQDFINGFYWATLPIKFVIQDENLERRSRLIKLSEAAIKEWEKETGFTLWNLEEDGSTNVIRWSTKFAAETKMDPETVLAVAIRYTDGPYISRSEIIINGNHTAFNTTSSYINNMNLGTTLVHEFGHTMGLDHSENELAVMAPNLQYPYVGLHFDDVDGMNEVFEQTEQRQITKYVSPLAYTPEKKSVQPFSCGTTVPIQGNAHAYISGILGILISLFKKIISYFKN